MPEGPEVARATDVLVSRLCVNGKWMCLVNAFKIGSRFQDVDIRALYHAFDKPIIDVFFKGKAYYFVLSRGISIRAHHKMEGRWSFEPDLHQIVTSDWTFALKKICLSSTTFTQSIFHIHLQRTCSMCIMTKS